jgi:hypothetical protein
VSKRAEVSRRWFRFWLSSRNGLWRRVPRRLKDRTEVANLDQEDDDWVLELMLPEHRWYTASQIEHKTLLGELRK